MKQIFIVFLALFTSFAAMSRTLTPEEALARLQMSRSNIRFAPTKYRNPKLIYTQDVASTDIPAVYIFNYGENGGYMVLSANDAVTPMLGYSDSGNIDPDNLPESFRWWIEEYARQIEWAERHPESVRSFGISRTGDFDPIEPQCKTTWEQRSPYNKYAPLENGQDCATGCVATAMAQVMKYHNWPPRGFDEHSYIWKGQTLSMNFEDVTFDWKNMLPDYKDDTYTEVQADAVAVLMKACGVSVNMNYGANGSGAYAENIPGALYKYFNYNRCYELVKSNFSEEEWIMVLWENLHNYGPVIYSGWTEDNTSGHTFICDGYSSNGYFHFNWGWDGSYDGYFLTGVGTSDYTAKQRGTFGIRPDSGALHIDGFHILEETRIDEPFEVRVDAYNPHDYAIDSEVVPILYSLSDKKFISYGSSHST